MVQRFLAFVIHYDRWLLYLGIPLLVVVMHWKVWPLELRGAHVWRQTQTQQTIDSFVEEDFCILNPRRLERGTGDGIARLEFPLYQWIVAAAGKLLGNSVLLGRIVSFLLSCVLAWGMHALLLAGWRDRLAALLAAYAGLLSPVVYYYGICPMPDGLALACAVWGLVFLMRTANEFGWRNLCASLVLVGLATLVKLPYGLFLAAPGVWWVMRVFQRDGLGISRLLGAAGLGLLALVPAGLWYAWAMPTWGSSGTVDSLIFRNWDWEVTRASLAFQWSQMYPRTLMSVALLPLFIWGCVRLLRSAAARPPKSHGWILVAVALSALLFNLLEVNVIGIDQDYYLLPMVPLLAIPIAIGGSHLLQMKLTLAVAVTLGLIALVPLMTYRRIHPRWEPEHAEFNRDLVLYQDALRAAVPDSALVVVGPDVSHNIFLYYIHKKGWCWDRNQTFGQAKLAEWQRQGAAYLYCDARAYDTLPELQPMLSNKVGSFGSIHIYRLQAARVQP